MQIAFIESCPIKSSTGWEDACRAEACGWEGIMVDSQRSDVHDDCRTAVPVKQGDRQCEMAAATPYLPSLELTLRTDADTPGSSNRQSGQLVAALE